MSRLTVMASANLLQWRRELREGIRNPEELVGYGIISAQDLPLIRKIHSNFPFFITPHYARLIDWTNPDDPLLRMVAPSLEEADRAGSLDVGGERENTQDEGIQMKYPSTVLVLPMPACFSYCRFCFRQRLFNPDKRGRDVIRDLDKAVEFIAARPMIDNVLLTGGDPLMIGTAVLADFLRKLRKIDHVKIIRFGTRAIVFMPSRVTSDFELLEVLYEMSQDSRRVYFVNHFNHPRELTPEVGRAVTALMQSGVVLANQTVMLRGVNDDPKTLADLLTQLAEWGISPYYVFQCKFIEGAGHFRVPLHETISIFQEATRSMNGLAKRVRLIMAHFSGKIEILGMEDEPDGRRIYLKYHQARDESLVGRILSYPLPPNAYWFDDLPGVRADSRLDAYRESDL